MTRTQRQQRLARPQIPLTWEIPVLVVLACLACAALAALLGQGCICWLAGAGFAWPTGHLAEAVGGLLRGQCGAGLTGHQRTALPSAPVVWLGVGIAEAFTIPAILLAVHVIVLALSGADGGLATAAQARRSLGVGSLRRQASVVRPDLQRGRDGRRPGRMARRLCRDVAVRLASYSDSGAGFSEGPRDGSTGDSRL